MLKVHAIIKRYKSKPTANVMFRVRDGKKVDLSYTSEIVVETDKWDNEIEGYPRRFVLLDSTKEEVNTQILSRIRLVQQVYENSIQQVVKPTSRWLTTLVNNELLNFQNERNGLNKNLLQEFDYYIETFVTNKKRKFHFYTVRNSFTRFGMYLSKINRKEISLNFKDINYDILCRYKIFLKNEHLLCVEHNIPTEKPISQARKPSTINGYLKKLRTFLNHYRKSINETYNPYEGFKFGSDTYSKPLHLTNLEFEFLQKVVIDNKRLCKIRDIFVLNCLLGFRVGDFFNLRHSDIVHGFIEYYPSKTKQYEVLVKVPLLKKAVEIIEKYKIESGRNAEYIVPRISLKTYNEGLKELFQLLNLDRMITYLDSESNHTAHTPLYDKISSHCARKTFIAGLVAAGISDRIICSMSGHKPHSREISRYYTISDQTQKDAIKNLEVKNDFSDLLKSEFELFNQLKKSS